MKASSIAATWAAVLPLCAAACGGAACPAGSAERDGTCQSVDDVGANETDAGAGLHDGAAWDGDTPVCVEGLALEESRCVPDPCLATAGHSPPCGEHASCTYEAGSIHCRCDEGYEGDGQTCERDPCVPLEGEPTPCGQNQRCERTGDVACRCADGFADCDGEASNGCEISVVDDANHCGACGFACAEGLACAEGACDQRVTTIVMHAMGYATCALTPAGEVLCWGGGNLPGEAASKPKLLSTYGRAAQLGLGAAHACIRHVDADRVTCWGLNHFANLGVVDPDARSHSMDIVGIQDLAVGALHTCAVVKGRIYCWGWSGFDTLGDNHAYPSSQPYRAFDADRPVLSARRLNPISGVTRVAAGHRLSCAQFQSGGIQCWGGSSDDRSLAENILPEDGISASPGPLQDVKDMCSGEMYGCAALENGSLVCWGADPVLLANAGNSTSPPPRNRYRTIDLADVTGVACGYDHACARTTAGEAYCWGMNGQGQLGIGTSESQRTTPTRVVGLSKVLSVHAGHTQSCARLSDGRVYCWGNNTVGGLGIGSMGGTFNAPQEIVDWP